MVIVIRWRGSINLAEAFVSLPIFVVDTPLATSGKLKIPYYGVEDVIVSIRYKKESRGIRNVSGQSDNFVSVDLQIGGHNVHIKLSSNNALVMGVTSVEEGTEAVNCLLDLIYQTDQNLAYLREVQPNVLERGLVYLASVATDNSSGLSLPDSDVFIAELEKHNQEHPDDKVDEMVAKVLLARGYELETFEELERTVNTLLRYKKIDPDQVEIIETEVSNSAYNYKLQFYEPDGEIGQGVFILKNLALAIIGMQNPSITAAHHNWHSKYANVVIATQGVVDGKLLLDGTDENRPQHVHRFNISESGSIRQWSPSVKEEAYLVHRELLSILANLIGNYSDVFVSATWKRRELSLAKES